MKEVVVTCNKTFLGGGFCLAHLTCRTILPTFREWLSTTMSVVLDSDPGWGRESDPN